LVGEEEDIRWSVIGHDLELSVDVKRTIHQTSTSGGRVSGRKRLEGVVDLLLVAGADGSVVHDRAESEEAIGNHQKSATPLIMGKSREGSNTPSARGDVSREDVRSADGEEVRSESSDQPLDEDWTRSRKRSSVGTARRRHQDGKGSLPWKTAAVTKEVRIPIVLPVQSSTDRRRIWAMQIKTKGTKKAITVRARAAASKMEERPVISEIFAAKEGLVVWESGRTSSSPDGDDILSKRVGDLGPDDLSVRKVDREISGRSGASEVDSETDSTLHTTP
jgi:hypothetical protein